MEMGHVRISGKVNFQPFLFFLPTGHEMFLGLKEKKSKNPPKQNNPYELWLTASGAQRLQG